MEKDDVFTESDSRKTLKIREPKDDTDIIPSVIAESKAGKEFDPSWFVVNVSIG